MLSKPGLSQLASIQMPCKRLRINDHLKNNVAFWSITIEKEKFLWFLNNVLSIVSCSLVPVIHTSTLYMQGLSYWKAEKAIFSLKPATCLFKFSLFPAQKAVVVVQQT